MINLKSVLPFWIGLFLNFCALLVLGWNFGSATGYGLITHWHNIWFVLSAIFMIFSLLLIFLMIVLSIWGICGNGKGAELQVGSWRMQAIFEFLMFSFGIATIFVFVFASASAGFVTFGAILYVLLVSSIIITYLVLRQKGLIEKQGMLEQISFSNEQEKSKKTKSKTKKQQTEKEWLFHSFFVFLKTFLIKIWLFFKFLLNLCYYRKQKGQKTC